MKYLCPKCNNEFEKGTKFCKNCGCNLDIGFIEKPTCPICKSEYPSNTRFCAKDGSKLVSPENLTPKCVICHQVYAEGIKFCPNDGGEIKILSNNTNRSSNNLNINKNKMFNNPFSFQGRIRRTEYGISVIIYIFLITVLNIASEVTHEPSIIIIAFIILIPILWFMLAQGVKRCHDIGNSGWWILIPLYGLWLLFQEGDLNENQYGRNPKK